MRSSYEETRKALTREAQRVEEEVGAFVADHGKLGVVQAPPGSGKTTLLITVADQAQRLKRRVAIATQTNAQANDICRRFARDYPRLPVVRFASHNLPEEPFGASVRWVTETRHLPSSASVTVAPAAKWGTVALSSPFDVLFIDEAWQLAWANFMLLGQVAERFLLVGDPGQIPPVVSIDAARWETSPRAPHIAAPAIILGDPKLNAEQWSLPATRRLPHDTVPLVRPFYDFSFEATTGPGEQILICGNSGSSAEDRAVNLLREGSAAGLTIPTPDDGPPLDGDRALADLGVRFIKRLLGRDARIRLHGRERALEPADIGLCATHRVMNSALALALPSKWRRAIMVDTAERWQGLERPVMLVVHPLSGITRPSSFDLQTGRLCVMASRHQTSMIVLSRDHVHDTLDACIPTADQPLGRSDVTGHGLFSHLAFWEALRGQGRIVTA